MNVISYLTEFYKNYLGEKGYIGITEEKRLIPYFYVGNHTRPIILAQYGIHAREYITTFLALEQLKYLQKTGVNGSVYILPMVNIDGVKICLEKDKTNKSNARGVDLNVNFDARWGEGEYNKRVAGKENYIGATPFSESETQALREFTLTVMPDLTLSYHSKGEEIYWYFSESGARIKRDYSLAKVIERETGYKIKLTPNSAGGYKDWCIDKLKIPAYTIEVGRDSLSHPIERKELYEIKKKNLTVITSLIKELRRESDL